MAFEVAYEFTELWVPARSTPVYLPFLVLFGLIGCASLLWLGNRDQWFEPERSPGAFLAGLLSYSTILLSFGLVISGGMVLLESRPSMAQADLLDKVRQGKGEQIEGYIWLRPELRDADDRIVQHHTFLIGRIRFPHQQAAASFTHLLQEGRVLQNGQYARVTHVKGNVVKVEIRR
ncbi:hypothetical protein [Ferrovibrio sp.]|uniref:hypothetical protein n=1 Tax=Ferrovibrio sp. TaxID=1917215 RepID=UPI001B7B6F61|nr:hypothetical protein [Ferrovibrio sp.]MBP7064373.1 hypothetical protein [Ferrovibrio sp.]